MAEVKNQITEDDLMKRILEVRNMDLEEEKRICEDLLALSDKSQNDYGLAFAYVYLFDSVLALGNYIDCDFYLSRAITLCKRNKFDRLFMVLSNFAGLYYLKLNDEKSAIEYFLEGINLANEFEEYNTCSKLYNNMGLAFAGRGDWETAKSFFEQAYHAIQKVKSSNENVIISYLSNLAESYIQLNKMEEARKYLDLSSQYVRDEMYYKIRLNAEWASYYSKKKDKENCLKVVQFIYDLHPEEYENRFFLCDMLEDIASDLVALEEYEWAKKFLDILDVISKEAPIVVLYRIQCVKIRYLEALNKDEELKKEYQNFYWIAKEINGIDNKMKSQSMISKIQLYKASQEREEMKLENEVLETEIQLDKLTNVYNRKYFNKLTSKSIQNKKITSLGILMMDIDYFKQYNDTYGHFIGDEALIKVAKVLKECARDEICVSRFGGDEFVCLCENISVEEVEEYIHCVRKNIEELHLDHKNSLCSNILTLSIGYYHSELKEIQSPKEILELADQALYKAKEAGRDSYYIKKTKA